MNMKCSCSVRVGDRPGESVSIVYCALHKAAPKLLSALKSAAGHLLETACTCADRTEGHQRDCSGLSFTKEFDYLIFKVTSAR